MNVSSTTALVLAAGWLIGSLFLIASYVRAGPVWIERHSLRFLLAGKERRCSGAVGEMAVLGVCAALLWAIDTITPGMNFINIMVRHPWSTVAALLFVSGVVAAYTANAVEHPDRRTKRRLRQTYAIYAVYSTMLFAGGMILIYCIVAQVIADTSAFKESAERIVSITRSAPALRSVAAQRAIEFTYIDSMLLLAQTKDQMTPVFIFAIAIFSINIAILYTPLRGLYQTNAVFLTNFSTLFAIAAVGATGAVVYIVSYNAFIQDYLRTLLSIPRDVISGDAMFQRRFTDIVLAMETKKSLVGFVSDMSNEWAGLTAVVGVVQAAASRLARKPAIAASLPSIAFEAAAEQMEGHDGAQRTGHG